MQSRLASLIESLTNVAIGMVVSFFGQIVVSHWYNLPLNFAQNMQIVLFFTVLSVARSFVVRRWFNRRIKR
jgi:membrane protein implicated in regulation of membrane protease activity